jgi:hypothetical protein
MIGSQYRIRGSPRGDAITFSGAMEFDIVIHRTTLFFPLSEYSDAEREDMKFDVSYSDLISANGE